jgi:ankyrin repeat protein
LKKPCPFVNLSIKVVSKFGISLCVLSIHSTLLWAGSGGKMPSEVANGMQRPVIDGDISAVKKLLKKYPPYFKEYPRMLVWAQSRPMAELLLEKGADLNSPDLNDVLLSMQGEDNLEAVQVLIERGAKFTPNSYTNPLLRAINDWSKNGDYRILKSMIAHGADVNLRGEQGYSLLSLIVISGKDRSEAIKILMANGANPSKDNSGFSPLHVAIYHNSPIANMKALLDGGADPFEKDKNGDTVLSLAKEKNNTQAIKLLNEYNTKHQNSNAVKTAATGTELERWNLIKDHIDESKPENLAIVKSLLAAGVKLDRAYTHGHSLLHLAVGAAKPGQKLEIVKALIAKGADINAPDNMGITPLALAADSVIDRSDLIQLMIEKGANPNFQEASGHTALNRAVQQGNYENVRALLEHGADPDLNRMTAQSNFRINEILKKFEAKSGRSEQARDRGVDLRVEQDRKREEELRAQNVGPQEKKTTDPLQAKPKGDTEPTYTDANPLEAFKKGFSETNQAKRRAAIAAFEKYKGPHRKAVFELAIKSGYPNVMQKAEELISTLPEKDEFTAFWMNSDDAHIRQFGMENQKRRGSLESLAEQGSKTEPVLAASLKPETKQANVEPVVQKGSVPADSSSSMIDLLRLKKTQGTEACRPAVNPQVDFGVIEKSAEVIAAVIPKKEIKGIVKSSGVPRQGILIAVNDDDPGVSRKFAALGKMYQVGPVVWSGIFNRPKSFFKKEGFANYSEANQFCKSLGGGARAPTQSEFEALGNALGSGNPQGYNKNAIPKMEQSWFFSSSVETQNTKSSTFFKGSSGRIFVISNKPSTPASVMCVVSP